MFNIEFLNDKGEKAFAWQTSWGLTTRTIGVMVMFHSDDKGLVLPPKLAQHQVIIVPVPFKGQEQVLEQKAEELSKLLKAAGIRSHVDKRDIYTPGWKYNHWELKGVPVRLELGPKDFEKQEVRAVKRNDGKKIQIKWSELSETVRMTRILAFLNKKMIIV
jgi:prolyl-tRNA synthetase